MSDDSIDQKILGDKPKWFNWKKKTILIVIICIAVFGYFKYGTIRTVNVTVADLDSKDGVFLIFTDQGTYKNVDSWWHFKTKSSDLQGKAAPGQHTMKIYGFRNGLLSSYPNVISID